MDGREWYARWSAAEVVGNGGQVRVVGPCRVDDQHAAYPGWKLDETPLDAGPVAAQSPAINGPHAIRVECRVPYPYS